MYPICISELFIYRVKSKFTEMYYYFFEFLKGSVNQKGKPRLPPQPQNAVSVVPEMLNRISILLGLLIYKAHLSSLH